MLLASLGELGASIVIPVLSGILGEIVGEVCTPPAESTFAYIVRSGYLLSGSP